LAYYIKSGIRRIGVEIMLKIKDSVDLKELEKFGFHKVKDYITNQYYAYLNGSLRMNFSNRKLVKNDAHFCEYDLDVIYDLFQADMIEKVEE
jgi:hypothetical protein